MLSFRRVSQSFRHLATYDVSPEFSKKVRRVVLSPLGVLALATAMAILCGLALHPRVFALAGGLGAVTAAGVCWPWLTVRGVRATLRYDRPRTSEGAEVGVTAAVSNPLPWPAWGLSVLEGETAVRLPAIAGRTRSSVRWPFMPALRGEYPSEAPTVATGFPFGLWDAKRRVAVEGKLIVWPRTFPVGPVPNLDGDEAVEGNVARNKIGSTGDVLGVRPYRRGDSPRRIHWAQSARHDRLIVCELQSTSRPIAMIVLDTAEGIHTDGQDGTREWAIRAAASMARGWIEAGAEVGIAFGDTVLSPRAGAEHVTRILDALAGLRGETRALADVLSSPALRAVRSAVRVIVTTDAGYAHAPKRAIFNDARWVVLQRSGFGFDGPLAKIGRVWLELPSVAEVPHRLRHGTAEASHGS